MNEKVYVAWRHPVNHSWHPVGYLYQKDQWYRFVYTKGALRSGFPLFPRMREFVEYRSQELFPVFHNRIISNKRPEYKNYLRWLDISNKSLDPLKNLGLTEGLKATDRLEFFQCPTRRGNNEYRVEFVLHGLEYLPKQVVERVNKLEEGERLYLIPDPQNEWDKDAMLLRTSDPVLAIGYCPRYLSRDFNKILRENNIDVNKIEVSVKRVNIDAPLNLRLLCKIVAPWPKNFQPCSDEEFQPIEKSFINRKNGISFPPLRRESHLVQEVINE